MDPLLDFTGKVAVITGAAQGFGKLLAKELAKRGAKLVISDINEAGVHKVADDIKAKISIPLIHIADATAQVLQADGITKVGLLGTRFTMEPDFYKNRLIYNFNIDVIVPDVDQQLIIHNVIYNELCLGVINDDSKKQYLNI